MTSSTDSVRGAAKEEIARMCTHPRIWGNPRDVRAAGTALAYLLGGRRAAEKFLSDCRSAGVDALLASDEERYRALGTAHWNADAHGALAAVRASDAMVCACARLDDPAVHGPASARIWVLEVMPDREWPPSASCALAAIRHVTSIVLGRTDELRRCTRVEFERRRILAAGALYTTVPMAWNTVLDLPVGEFVGMDAVVRVLRQTDEDGRRSDDPEGSEGP
jgi:hypothetical protein